MLKKAIGIIFLLVVLFVEALIAEEVRDGFVLVSPSEDKAKYWRIEGSSANFLEDNWIEIYDLKAVFFDKQKRKYYVKTSKAKIQRDTKEMITNNEISIWRDGLTINSIGMHMVPEGSKVVFKKKVSIETYSKSIEDLI